jgi:CHAT domain-containing protein/uncharacterized protein associated with vWA-MoxR-VMAP ternary system
VPTITRASGVQVQIPETMAIAPAARPATGRRRRAAGGALTPGSVAESAAENQLLIDALADQRFELVDSIPLRPQTGTGSAAASRRRAAGGRAPTPEPVSLNVPIRADESAVVLLEQDGYYQWSLPDRVARPARSRTRRGATVESTVGTATFRFDLHATEGLAAQRAQTRGLGRLVMGGVRAIVLKFAAHVVIDKVISHMEAHVQPGFIVLDSDDPTAWGRVENIAALKLPTSREPRILLFVHGTFSSTVGDFGSLAAHPWGTDFLAQTRKSYDAVIGYDHRTLSPYPSENASDLLERLRVPSRARAPRIDIVAHSRGGLVVRSLIEQLLPSERDFRPTIGRVVFSACTNHGTLLAEPDNWRDFLDLYTNLAVAATRPLLLLPQAALAGVILSGIVRGVGALVKFLVDATIAHADVPGLAAMEPDGPFVTKINQTQPKQPDPAHSEYYVISSNFETDAPGTSGPELPKRLQMRLRDGFIDRLFGAPSDLIVDVASMSSIDPKAGNFVDDVLDFGTNSTVYHSNYFHQPQVANALARWLDLPTEGVAVVSPRGGRRRRRTSARPPAIVDTDVVEVSSTATGEEVRSSIETAGNPAYVVVIRPAEEGSYRFAFETREVTSKISGAKAAKPIGDVLDLHEDHASPTMPMAAAEPVAANGGPPSTKRGVVVAGNDIVGVIPESVAVESVAVGRPTRPSPVKLRRMRRATGMKAAARKSSAKKSVRNGGGRSRPTLKARTSRARRPESSAPRVTAPDTGLTHAYADMAPDVVVGETVPVHIEISPAALQRARGRTAKGTDFRPDRDLPLIVQVLARQGLEVVGADEGQDRVEIPVPAPGDPPQELYFDVRGTVRGEGELWVILRQGHPSLATLVLTPNVLGKADRSATRRRLHARAALSDQEPAQWAIPTLRINERPSSDGVVYEYDLDLLQYGNLRDRVTVAGDRDAIIQSIYKDLEDRWIETDQDVEAFQSDIRDYGAELFVKLFPTKIRNELWKHRNTLKSIRVMSSEPFIPWELVHLTPATGRLPKEMLFLGQLGLVRWLVNEPSSPVELRIRRGKAWYVTPDYPGKFTLTEPAVEAAFLTDQFGAKAVEPHRMPVMNLLKQRGAVDLFHFAGHGAASGGTIEDARVLLNVRESAEAESGYVEENLMARSVLVEAHLADPEDSPKPLVILNACQAGRLGYSLSGTGGFATAFIHAGAGAFISSLWSVGDEPASTFTRRLYERLKAGERLSVAAVKAREAARSAGDATWLAYVVYGHPDARLTKR